MTLTDFLPVIAHNPKLTFTIYESDNSEVITFHAAGYEALSSELMARQIDKITVAEEGTRYLKLYLKALPTVEPEPEPEPNNGEGN